ncbi:MAG TPA: hypothetical protein PKO34_08550 [Smithellaceae bacterium]|nr:hypothetical protein [Smithellaceae bacterium]
MRKEAYSAYAAVTNDEAQRSIRPFYEVVRTKRGNETGRYNLQTLIFHKYR